MFISGAQGGSALAGLTAGQITAFVMAWCRQCNASQAKMMVTALRSLLRFLHVSGHLTTSLTGAVPSVPGWRKVRLPRPLDRRNALGRRDYAVILLMARLGLRAGDAPPAPFRPEESTEVSFCGFAGGRPAGMSRPAAERPAGGAGIVA